ncbi:MAG: hypothetical protein KF810_20695 [Rhizobiaceae bacterium]|nr:hypothetical protein [Rhizobiaceae bacterium]
MSASPSIYRLLATYWESYEALGAAMDAADDTDPRTPEREAADEVQRLAGEALDDAAVAICAFVPGHAHEARIKANFLTQLIGENGAMDRNWADALIGSLPRLYAQRAEA